MKCFIHQMKEAVGTCKKCGKAMCVDCSAYSNHSGTCPECKREEYILEAAKKRSAIAKLKRTMIISIVLSILVVIVSVLVCVLFESPIPLVILLVDLFFGVRIIIINKKISPLSQRVAWLDEEIRKLTTSLNVGSTILKV